MSAKTQDDEVSRGRTCLTPECGKDARWKGLCTACYGSAKQLIDDNETTWDELHELGLAIVPRARLATEFRKRKAAKLASEGGDAPQQVTDEMIKEAEQRIAGRLPA